MSKIKEKRKALKLRLKGKSISEISQTLNIRRATISKWCKELKITNKEKRLIKKAVEKESKAKLEKLYLQKREAKKQLIEKIQHQAHKDIIKVSKRELFLMGVMLYWAEGFKSEAEHRLGFCNSDPHMILFYLKWLKDCFGVKQKDITLRVTLNSSYKNKAKQIQFFWSDTTGIPESQFTKPFFQTTTWKKKFKNKNEYYGVLRIHVKKSLKLLWKTLGWIKAIRSLEFIYPVFKASKSVERAYKRALKDKKEGKLIVVDDVRKYSREL